MAVTLEEPRDPNGYLDYDAMAIRGDRVRRVLYHLECGHEQNLPMNVLSADRSELWQRPKLEGRVPLRVPTREGVRRSMSEKKRRSYRNLTASMSVNGQDCGDSFTAEDCEAVAMVFDRAARAIRLKEHGQIECNIPGVGCLALVAIDQQDENDPDWKELPVLERIKRPRRKR